MVGVDPTVLLGLADAIVRFVKTAASTLVYPTIRLSIAFSSPPDLTAENRVGALLTRLLQGG
jgi:hypothetical protein